MILAKADFDSKLIHESWGMRPRRGRHDQASQPHEHAAIQSSSTSEKEEEETEEETEEEDSDVEEDLADITLKMKEAVINRKCRRLAIASTVLTALGVVLGMKVEKWDFVTSLYVITQIVTTVGYGDVTVTAPFMKEFMAVYTLLCLVFFAYAINLGAQTLGEDTFAHFKTHVRSWERQHGEQLEDFLEKSIPLREEPPARRSSETELAIQRARLDSLKEERIDAFNNMILWGLVFLGFILFGACFYGSYEHCTCSYGRWNIEGCEEGERCPETKGYQKDFFNALYMSVITLTTVGFGDHSPKTKIGRCVGIFWMLCGVSCTVKFLESMTRLFFEIENKTRFKLPLMCHKLFKRMDTGHKGFLTKADFRSYMLVQYGLIPEALVHEIDLHFARLCPDTGDQDDEPRLRFSDLQEVLERPPNGEGSPTSTQGVTP